MSDIPIFDCLTHPSLDGSWIDPRHTVGNSFEQLCSEGQEVNVPWCFAVSMGVSGPYDRSRYVAACTRQTRGLFPVAFFPLTDCISSQDVEESIAEIRRLGFCGIKLHPRLSRFSLNHPLLPVAIRAANANGLLAFLCTYFYSSDAACRDCSSETLRLLLHEVPNEKLILLHSGGVRCLEISELTRPFKRVLLDMSFTMCEYAGSSVDLDLQYVFQRCSSRVCVGSDSPGISLKTMRTRFEQLTKGLDRGTRERIAYQNLFAFSELSA